MKIQTLLITVALLLGVAATVPEAQRIRRNGVCVDCTASSVIGTDTQVAFNDAGTMAGNAAFVFNKTTGQVTSTLNQSTFVGPTSLDNAAGTPAFRFQTSTNTGMMYNFGDIAFTLAGSRVYNFGTGTLDLLSDVGSIRIGSGNDMTITRRGAGEFGLAAVLFANLGAPANGTFCYCSDCTIASPCASGGTGAWAKRLNATWVCN